MKKIIIVSGYFNPIHIGHLNLLKSAKELGDFLVVIVNNDKQVTVKGSVPFMKEHERVGIIKDNKHVDEVFLSIDKDISVAKSIEAIAQKYEKQARLCRALGGDRNFDNLPEAEKEICKRYGIEVINGVGGGKVQSSSTLLKNVNIS